jgi:hypothetical protein
LVAYIFNDTGKIGIGQPFEFQKVSLRHFVEKRRVSVGRKLEARGRDIRGKRAQHHTALAAKVYFPSGDARLPFDHAQREVTHDAAGTDDRLSWKLVRMLDGPLGVDRAAVIENLGLWVLENIGREDRIEFGPRLFARQPIKCLFEGGQFDRRTGRCCRQHFFLLGNRAG